MTVAYCYSDFQILYSNFLFRTSLDFSLDCKQHKILAIAARAEISVIFSVQKYFLQFFPKPSKKILLQIQIAKAYSPLVMIGF